ncbi:hypothetical protein OAO87_01270 [bacterium]|nr:hypothetical protein [bacterium]
MLTVGLAYLNIECPGEAKRPRRSTRSERLGSGDGASLPALASVETDAASRIVFVNLEPCAGDDGEDAVHLRKLRASLIEKQPTDQQLTRLPPINRNRVLWEIEDQALLTLFSAWLQSVAVSESTKSEGLRAMLRPLGSRLRLVGMQLIVPKLTEYEPSVRQQAFHTDVADKGEVLAVAIHARGFELGTLLHAKGRLGEDGTVISENGETMGRAATSAFIYDTGTPHAGPALHIATPTSYPHYVKDRVFALLCADSLDPTRLAQHRSDNGLVGRADMRIDLSGTAAAADSSTTTL